MILRVQDSKGRGPWRPGLSEKWVDSFRTSQNPPIYEEYPEFVLKVREAHGRGLHIGCAARGRAGLLSWFSPMEIVRLSDMGFRVVDASACDVLHETPTQVLIASDRPLRLLRPVGGVAA